MRFFERVLDLIYPRVCGICDGGSREAICAACASGVAWYEGASCPGCGAPQEMALCRACGGRAMSFRRAIALGAYAGTLRDFVLTLKFRGGEVLAPPLGRRLADRVRSAAWDVDVVTFVPTSRWRLFAGRRHNVSELLADSLARHLGKPLRSCLRKLRQTRLQTALPRSERLKNPQGAYRAHRRVADRAVLLVDDVLTTGATACACADALYAARAREVNVAVVARSLSSKRGVPSPSDF